MNAHANEPVIESAHHSSRLDAGPSFSPGQKRPLGKIAHLTSVHARDDVRIFIKQCRTLSAHGYEVTLVVADGNGDERRDGVTVVDVGTLPGRLNRMFVTVRRVLERAIALDADIYHLHDPELIPTGLELKRLGKTVIFDAHEDTPRQLLGKPYLNRLSRHALSLTFSRFERYACSRFDAIVAATPFIRDKFLHIHPITVDVNNFPMTGELDAEQPWAARQQEVSYVGGIGATRGIRQLVQAAALLRSPTRINLAGRFSEPEVEAEVRGHTGWARINELGFLDRAGLRDVLARSLAGVVTLLPLPNYLESYPTKMFEYMSAGIPVIASDFPLLRTIVEDSRCGLCVDPLDPGAIAAAIDYLADHPDLAQSMGENGRKAVSEKYSWNVEARKLTGLYGDLAHAK